VFLIRHGQSEWNLAAKRLDLWTMLSQVDHALTREGVNQAKRLREAVECARAADDEDAKVFLAPSTRVFSSPLKRAVSTAAVALGPSRRITLLPDARELAWPIGGPDSIGSATGEEIARSALQALGSIDPQYGEGSAAHEDLAAAIDASAARTRWWTGFRESRRAVAARLSSLLASQLLPTGCGASVLVCHSVLIRQVFVDCASPALAESQPELLARLRVRKLENCGVVRVELDAAGLISSAGLAFESKLL